jgi:hypothetical protein
MGSGGRYSMMFNGLTTESKWGSLLGIGSKLEWSFAGKKSAKLARKGK